MSGISKLPTEIWEHIYKIVHRQYVKKLQTEICEKVSYRCVFIMEENSMVQISEENYIGDDLLNTLDANFVKIGLLVFAPLNRNTRYAYYNNTLYCMSIQNDNMNLKRLKDEPIKNKIEIFTNDASLK